jgi:hypothetical protein
VQIELAKTVAAQPSAAFATVANEDIRRLRAVIAAD